MEIYIENVFSIDNVASSVIVYRYICKEGSSVPCPSDEISGYRCPAGFYCPSGSSIELPCPPGTFSPMPGASSCLLCPAGSSCMHVSTVEPANCPQGNYCPAMTVVPVPCPEGTYNSLEGALSSDSCKICPSGQYCRGEGNWQPDGKSIFCWLLCITLGAPLSWGDI
ncbi:signal peptide, CUB and EGF-like domain-containing protein 1 [Xenopus laevis]|uniref:Signal peptide, CUB and EGF-like domain-containing protein 1 n=1 Tax=Xenopus laevis TaxID=8355 RepID=A0A8J1L6B6_XENLA|nr:signal peptide, CUB and EGF-like domain-containing protein 1 [Xenopus laevis]